MPLLERANQPRLYYEIDDFTDPWKDAPYILLLHGYARSTKFWRFCVPYLARFYRVIRLDLRGQGQSDSNFDLVQGTTFEAYIDDFTALLDHLGIESAHLCGESSAGTLGLGFAAERPHRVRTLSVISSPVFMTEADKQSALHGYPDRVAALRAMGARGWMEASNAGRRFPADADPAMLQWTLDEMGTTETEVLVAMFEFLSNVDLTPLLPKITAPVLGLYPAGGVITTGEHHALLRQHVKYLQLIHVPSAAHSLQIVQPALTATTVLHFIAAHDGMVCHEA